MSSDRSVPLLVLGLGNVLCGDDGLGAVAVHLLQRRYRAPDGVSVLDGGTLGLSLLPYLEEAHEAILVDAIRGDGPPGSFVRLEGDEVGPAVAGRLSVHQVGLSELLAASRFQGTLPEKMTLLGIEPLCIEWGLDLSPPVSAALDGLIGAAVRELRAWGVEVERA